MQRPPLQSLVPNCQAALRDVGAVGGTTDTSLFRSSKYRFVRRISSTLACLLSEHVFHGCVSVARTLHGCGSWTRGPRRSMCEKVASGFRFPRLRFRSSGPPRPAHQRPCCGSTRRLDHGFHPTEQIIAVGRFVWTGDSFCHVGPSL